MRKITMLVIAAFAVTSAAAQFNPQQPIPADKDVRTGKLENGMTYYILSLIHISEPTRPEE